MDQETRKNRKRKIRAIIAGTAERPRAAVYRSLNTVSVQFVDDVNGHTLLTASSRAVKSAKSNSKAEVAKIVGEEAARQAKEKGIQSIVFDRGGYAYHGRVSALAEGMRDGGLVF